MARLGFVTCVQLGLGCMEAIYECGAELALAITLPDDKAQAKSGRIYLDGFCATRGIPLVKSANVNDAVVVDAVRNLDIDWLFIIGWSQIARSAILAAPKLGVLGAHPTLLPVGRGRAAIPWAILKRLDKTGVTLFKMDEGVDTGPIAGQFSVEVSPFETATALYEKVDAAHRQVIAEFLPKLTSGVLELVQQDDSAATYWPGRSPEDGLIDLSGSVQDAECLVRAVSRPYPGAFYMEGNRKVVVWKSYVVPQPKAGVPCVQFKDGWLCLDEVEYLDRFVN